MQNGFLAWSFPGWNRFVDLWFDGQERFLAWKTEEEH